MIPTVKSDYLQRHPLFANVSLQKITAAAELMKLTTVYRGEAVSYGDGAFSKIHLLFNGKIKLAAFSQSEGEMIKEIITAPDIFGNLTMDGHASKDEYAEALTYNALIGTFTITDFKKLLEVNPMMGIAYASLVTGKLGRLESRHADLIYCDTKSRLIHFIKNWALSDGRRVGDKILLKNYLTHADIANVISSSRQSVNILLNELRTDGMLLYNRTEIELSNLKYWN